MASRRKSPQSRPQIDVDWLLGESTADDVRHQVWLTRSIVALAFIVATIFAWPHASRVYLQWEWRNTLSESNTDDSLPLLVALSDIDPDNSLAVIEQLGHPNRDRRQIAFQLLRERIETLTRQQPDKRTHLLTLLEHLDALESVHPETLKLRGYLANLVSKPFDLATPADEKIRQVAQRMMEQSKELDSSATDLPLERMPPIVSAPTKLASTPNPGSHKVRLSDSPPAVVAEGPSPVHDASVANGSEATVHPTPETTLASFSRPNIEVNSGSRLQPSSPNSLRYSQARQPVNDPSTYESVFRATRDSTPPTISSPSKASFTKVLVQEPPRLTQEADKSPMRGFETLTIEQLIPLLASSQPKVVGRASEELIRQGLKPHHLDLAIRLASGNSQERVELLDAFVRDSDLNPIPWLVWMAETADRTVKLKAISLLGSIHDPQAIEKLRHLGERETDTVVTDQIHQILSASTGKGKTIRR